MNHHSSVRLARPKIARFSHSSATFEQDDSQCVIIAFNYDKSRLAEKDRIQVLDLSRSGMLLETSAELQLGDAFEIEIIGIGPVGGTIAWRAGQCFGAIFDTPISESAVRNIILTAPSEPGPLDEAELDAIRRFYPKFDPTPDWLVWVVLIVTTVSVLLYVYALSFLLVSA